MGTSALRIAANRDNAQKSTGPTSDEGKIRSMQNATRHGLLSRRLFVDDEDPAEFETLLLELQSGLAPVGSLEFILVERIGITLWRQRRLVGAETSALSLTREPMKIAAAVSKELGRGYGHELKENDIERFDRDRVTWCNQVVSEIGKLQQIDLASLPTLAPLVFEQLKSDAEEDHEAIEALLAAQAGGLTGFVDHLLMWCKEQLAEAEKRPRLVALAKQVRARRLILPDDMLEVFSRYQTTLDNQLYKALRALRDAQEWRLKTLDHPAPIEPTATSSIV
jgi:hypothetical protein